MVVVIIVPPPSPSLIVRGAGRFAHVDAGGRSVSSLGYRVVHSDLTTIKLKSIAALLRLQKKPEINFISEFCAMVRGEDKV